MLASFYHGFCQEQEVRQANPPGRPGSTILLSDHETIRPSDYFPWLYQIEPGES